MPIEITTASAGDLLGIRTALGVVANRIFTNANMQMRY